MSNIPKQGRILSSDFPDEKFMPKLLYPINSFIEDVKRALNKGLTFKDNMSGDVVTVLLDGVYPLDIKWNLKQYPVAAWIGQCREVSGNHTTITTALYLDWEMTTDGALRINNVAGLSPSVSNKFTAKIVTITG